MRAWMPQRHGAYFTKHRQTQRRPQPEAESEFDQLRQLVRTADVLIENLKPGALARMGLSVEQVTRSIRVALLCSHRFGHDSIYPGCPAYDTVIQAVWTDGANTRGGCARQDRHVRS